MPYLVHLSMRQARLTEYRQRVVRGAKGRVLEIGIGSGINLALYTRDVTHVIGIDPSRKLLSFGELYTRTFSTFRRELSPLPRCQRGGAAQCPRVVARREQPTIILMASIGRAQQRYDHRLRDLVRGTGT
jgi:SAM-dependent methyltransferase